MDGTNYNCICESFTMHRYLGTELSLKKHILDFSNYEMLPPSKGIVDFRYGIVNDVDDRGKGMLVKRIEEWISDPEHICMFSDMCAEKGDPWLKKEDICVLYLQEQVYYLLDHTASIQRIEDTVRVALSGLLMVFATYQSLIGFDVRASTIDGVALSSSSLNAVAVGVCDGQRICYMPTKSVGRYA